MKLKDTLTQLESYLTEDDQKATFGSVLLGVSRIKDTAHKTYGSYWEQIIDFYRLVADENVDDIPRAMEDDNYVDAYALALSAQELRRLADREEEKFSE